MAAGQVIAVDRGVVGIRDVAEINVELLPVHILLADPTAQVIDRIELSMGNRLVHLPIDRIAWPIVDVITVVAQGTRVDQGLVLLSQASSAVTAIAAATVFAVGICYFWPTMLGVTSERFPSGGALLLGIMGGAGNLSVALALPVMGGIYDTSGPSTALLTVAILPVVLIIIFGTLYWRDRATGGYKIVNLSGNTEGTPAETAPTSGQA